MVILIAHQQFRLIMAEWIYKGDYTFDGEQRSISVREDFEVNIESALRSGWTNNTHKIIGDAVHVRYPGAPMHIKINNEISNGEILNKRFGKYFKPDRDFNGSTIINYQVGNDLIGWKDSSILVNVTPENDAPIWISREKIRTVERSVTEITKEEILANAKDIDGDNLKIDSFAVFYNKHKSSFKYKAEIEETPSSYKVHIPSMENKYNYEDYYWSFDMVTQVSDGKGGNLTLRTNLLVKELDPVTKQSEEGKTIDTKEETNIILNNTVNNYFDSSKTSNNINSWNTYKVNNSIKARDIVIQWFGNDSSVQQVLSISVTKILVIQTSSWNDKVLIKSVAQAGNAGGKIEAPQIDDLKSGNQGSVLNGAGGKDQIQAKAGWDLIDGGDNDDFIRAGNGRDIISGGLGADQLWGDFGWNTYKSEKDGFRDLIAIKSDQNLVNWLYGKAGNNSSGQKADIIEGLDANDVIKIIGASTGSLRFGNTSAHGISGIGIFAGDSLEALYTGGDLSVDQIRAMTSGDVSAAALNNTLSIYGSW